MISLLELLNTIKSEKDNNLIRIDDWKWPDVDHLANMGFDFDDDYYMKTFKSPIMTIYMKWDPKPEDGVKRGKSFYLEEEGKEGIKKFNSFTDVLDYFDSYYQPEIDDRK